MRVHVVRAWPRRTECREVDLHDAATVADAIAASGWAMPEASAGEGVAVFGEQATVDRTLLDGDRVELLRPLQVDPKQARRLRATRAQP